MKARFSTSLCNDETDASNRCAARGASSRVEMTPAQRRQAHDDLIPGTPIPSGRKGENWRRFLSGDKALPPAGIQPVSWRGFSDAAAQKNPMTQLQLYPLSFEPIFQYRLWGGTTPGQLDEQATSRRADRASLGPCR